MLLGGVVQRVCDPDRVFHLPEQPQVLRGTVRPEPLNW
jgi:hypothetical protein